MLDALFPPAWRRERTLAIIGIRTGLRLTSMLSLRIADVALFGTAPNAYLFPGRRSGTRLHRITGWRAFKAAFDHADLYGSLGELGTHTLQKTFARLIYSALGHDFVRTSYAMRHASVSTTAEYPIQISTIKPNNNMKTPTNYPSELGPTHDGGPDSRRTMNGKPVIYRENARTVLTEDSREFQEKLLCDGITMNLGDACAFSCEFCYVEAAMRKLDKPLIDHHNERHGLTGANALTFPEVVIRRRNAVGLLRGQLLRSDGTTKFNDPGDRRVVYSSTLVDVAANMELLRETAECCNLILKHTSWQIRLLSKSHLLHKLVEDLLIPMEYHSRLILGFSTGTLEDKLARAFETGTALVSKRIESLHWLQDRGIRTFGMICPSLPQENYDAFSRDICDAVRVDRCEHIWAEVINVRGQSLTRTLAALRQARLNDSADRLESVSGANNMRQWEDYARATFLAHTRNVIADKLRFLQYVKANTADWWTGQRRSGAVLLGAEAKARRITALDYSSGENGPGNRARIL